MFPDLKINEADINVPLANGETFTDRWKDRNIGFFGGKIRNDRVYSS